MLTFGFVAIIALAFGFRAASIAKAIRSSDGQIASLHSRPFYHGSYSFLVVLIAGGGVLLLGMVGWAALDHALLMRLIHANAPTLNPIQADLVLSDGMALARGSIASQTEPLRETVAAYARNLQAIRIYGVLFVTLLVALTAGWWTYRPIGPDWRARNRTEAIIRAILWTCAAVAVLTTIGIVLSLIFETISFFDKIGWRVDKFLFGTTWSPLSGVQSGIMDQNRVGILPLFVGTFMITLIAMIVAVPIGLFSAIYLSEFARPKVRFWAKPMLEILAGIPTVVYGFFAALTVAPFIRGFGEGIGISIASESALAAGVVMGIMIIPFISSLSDDVINAVPQSLRDGSYGLGATKAETIRQVVLPAALPGIVSAVLLGVSRAVGETMIVVMAAGQGANLTLNPLQAVTTVTVQIVMLITGDTEADTAAGPAFSLGFTLFLVTLALNVIALRVVRKYRELYD